MRILGIETSTFQCSAGVVIDGKIHQHAAQLGRSIHSEKLLDLVDAVLQPECALSDLDAIAVGIGPGSYTGLRIGLSTAKGLALPYDLPVLPIPTLATLERVARTEWDGDLMLWIRSHRDLVYSSCSEAAQNQGLDIRVQHRPISEVLEQCKQNARIFGDYEWPLPAGYRLTVDYPRGDIAALLASENFARLQQQSTPELVPNYMSNFEAKPWQPKLT